jgi:glucose-6-phosphate dehydrogenase assembly protein OpcA
MSTPPAARRSLTATVIAIGPAERTREAVVVLQALASRASVRNILITLGDNPEPEMRHNGDVITVDGLLPRYLNNAVAKLRLSSMPSLAWWRGGDRAELEDLAELVDRVVLDSVDPREDWDAARAMHQTAAITDLRWTRLTGWRNLMAQFFDIPETRAAAGTFSRLEVAAGDRHAATLFAGWMSSRLPAGRGLHATVTPVSRGATVEAVTLSGDGGMRLLLRLLANKSCIESSVEHDGRVIASRVAPAADERMETLLAEELRVRSRDLAFEEALGIGEVGS